MVPSIAVSAHNHNTNRLDRNLSMSGLQQVQGAFETARKDFLNNLTNKNHYNFSNIRNINDVYNETQRIQEIQGSQGTLRNLNRIRPFLRRIEEYASVIEIFILVKPEVLALLWVCFKPL